MAVKRAFYTSVEIEKAFNENEIVPDSLSSAPKKIVNVKYPSGVTVDLGNELTPTQVKDTPKVEWDAEKGVYYSLLMVDLDAPSRQNPTLREVRHWFLMNIRECFVENGEELFEYRGAGPPKGTELHRYVILVYKQPNGIIRHNEPRSSRRNRVHRLSTSALKFSKKYNLGDPEFGNFFQAQYDQYVDVLQAQTTETSKL